MISRYPERKRELINYVSWLLDMDNGKLRGPFNDLTEVPQQMVCNSTEELEHRLLNDFLNNIDNVDYLSQRAIMSTKHDFINQKHFKFTKRILGEMHISYSRDRYFDDDGNTLHEPELNRINSSGVLPHRLPLKAVVPQITS